MYHSGLNSRQFIILPGGTESAAVQVHETSFIAPITHLGDLHLNHGKGSGGSKWKWMFLFKTTHGVSLEAICFRLNKHHCKLG